MTETEDYFDSDAMTSSASSRASRVIIKNLPKYATDEQLRKHLSVRGYTITDVKLAKTK